MTINLNPLIRQNSENMQNDYFAKIKKSKKRGIYNIETVTAIALYITILNQHYFPVVNILE